MLIENEDEDKEEIYLVMPVMTCEFEDKIKQANKGTTMD